MAAALDSVSFRRLIIARISRTSAALRRYSSGWPKPRPAKTVPLLAVTFLGVLTSSSFSVRWIGESVIHRSPTIKRGLRRSLSSGCAGRGPVGLTHGISSAIRSFRLDAGRLHDRQQPRFLSIAEDLDLGRRGRPGRGAQIVVARFQLRIGE